MKWNKEDFIKKAKEVHGSKYDYIKVEYINSRTKVIIQCTEHGIFLQIPSNHIRGYGCPDCAIDRRTNKQEDFIKKAKEVHGSKYDYIKVEYINNNVKVAIICSKHGIFLQEPQNHLRNHGCPICMVDNHVLKHSFTKEKFIEEAKKIHGNKYDYSEVEYVNINTGVKIICKKHGEFNQCYNSHINQKSGCPKCKMSRSENYILNWLNKFKINFLVEKTFEDCLSIKGRSLPFDFYLPDYNTCIEFDGIHHFYPIDFSHGKYSKEEIENQFLLIKQHDKIKNEYCYTNNICLIRISYKQNIKKELKKWLLKARILN